MEILFNNEKPFQRGMFMGIESVFKRWETAYTHKGWRTE